LEAVSITIAHRLNGFFDRILRCFPLQSVRIAAENRLACGQKISFIRRTLAMETTSDFTHSSLGKRLIFTINR
jgi:hypothetical protein